VATGSRAVRFTLAGYDHTLPLVIDPTIDFASYLGTGANEEVLWAETRSGSVYVSGRTWQSTAFPKVPAGTDDFSAPHCFISKFTRDGSDLAWSVVFDWTGTLAHECGPFALGPDSKIHAALRFFPRRQPVGRERLHRAGRQRRGLGGFELLGAGAAAGPARGGSRPTMPGNHVTWPVRAAPARIETATSSCRTVARYGRVSGRLHSSSAFGNPAAFESLLLKISLQAERLYGTFIGGTPFRAGTGEVYDRKPDTIRASSSTR